MKIFTLLTAAFLFSTSSLYGQCVKGNCFNGLGPKTGKMVTITKVLGKKDCLMVTVSFPGIMEIVTRGDSRTVK